VERGERDKIRQIQQRNQGKARLRAILAGEIKVM
jgi:hypothetical protein